MKRHNVGGLCLLTCILLLANAGSAIAQKPIPKDKKSATQVTASKVELKYYQRNIDQYRRRTKDPESLRPLAEEFLRTVHLGELSRARGPGPAKTAAMGKKLIEQGCKDPLVNAYHAYVACRSQDRLTAIFTLRDAVDALRRSDYPLECRRLVLYDFYYHGLRVRGMPKWNVCRDEALKLAFAQVADATLSPAERRVVLRELTPLLCDAKRNWPVFESFYKGCQSQPKSDPWLFNMIAGHYYYTAARRHRGTGWASSVTPEAFRLFHENLKKAAEHFQKAYKLHPEFPQAASTMVWIALLGGNDLSPREWFDRAVAAQMDYPPAYGGLRQALRPRWGGSHSAMYRFGCECADTERYDTNVPYGLVQILNDIDEELGGGGEAWKRPGVYAKVKRVLEGMARDPSRADGERLHLSKSSVMSIHAAVAGLAEEYADARRLLDELGDRFVRSLFNVWVANSEIRLAEIYVLTGKGANDFEKASELFDTAGPKPLSNTVIQEARSLFKKALEADDNERSRAFCQSRLDEVDDYLAFNAGKWVEKKFETKTLCWKGVAGKWSVKNDRSVAGVACKPYSRVMLRLAVVPPVPLEIEFEVKLPIVPRVKGQMLLGLFVPQRDQDALVHQFYVDMNNRKAGVKIMGKTKEIVLGLYKTSRFHVQLADGRAVLYVNDNLCFDHSDKDFHPSSNLNLGCYRRLYPNLTVNVSNVRIRKWDPTKEPTKEKETP